MSFEGLYVSMPASICQRVSSLEDSAEHQGRRGAVVSAMSSENKLRATDKACSGA